MTADELIGCFLYGLTELKTNNYGLIPGANSEDDIAAVGALAVLAYRIADRGQTPADLALSRLATTTGALLGARCLPAEQQFAIGERVVAEWRNAKTEYEALCVR
jgi:hypothetical protein